MATQKYLAELVGAFLLTFAVTASLHSGFPILTPVVAGLTLGLVVYTLGGVSGAHINPAVTIGLWSIKKIGLTDGVIYIIAQFIGAWLAMMLGKYLFGAVGALTITNSLPVFLAEAIGAFILVFGVTSIVLKEHSTDYSGVVIGGSLLLGASIASLVSNGVLNPAVAFGIGSFSLVYALGPIVGALVAAMFMKYLVKTR